MNSIQTLSVLSLVFGIVILINPAIIAFLIAAFFIIIGLNGLIFGAKINRFWKIRINK